MTGNRVYNIGAIRLAEREDREDIYVHIMSSGNRHILYFHDPKEELWRRLLREQEERDSVVVENSWGWFSGYLEAP